MAAALLLSHSVLARHCGYTCQHAAAQNGTSVTEHSKRHDTWYTGAGSSSRSDRYPVPDSSGLTNRSLASMEESLSIPGAENLAAWTGARRRGVTGGGADLSRVVEIGAGEGRVTLELQHMFPAATVTGLNKPFGRFVNVARSRHHLEATAHRYGVELARNVLTGQLPSIELREAPSTYLQELESGSVDLVVSQATFQWVSPIEQRTYFGETMRVLRNGSSPVYSQGGVRSQGGVALISWPLGDASRSVPAGRNASLCGQLFGANGESGVAMVAKREVVLVVLAKGGATRVLNASLPRLHVMGQQERARFFSSRYNHKHLNYGTIWRQAIAPLARL
mmetsp:Transcript_36891/g.86185  ORF Transcript_36891/g.86185 Transcript_36891/m.86185 type:complete len:336 (-) Transcript_36891:79-1086(-)